jgi:hypothetical protein
VRHTKKPHQPIGQPGVKIDVDQDGNCQQKHHGPLVQDVLGLKGEDQHQGGQERHDGDRAEDR